MLGSSDVRIFVPPTALSKAGAIRESSPQKSRQDFATGRGHMHKQDDIVIRKRLIFLKWPEVRTMLY